MPGLGGQVESRSVGGALSSSAFRVFGGAPREDTCAKPDSGAAVVGNMIPGEYIAGAPAVGGARLRDPPRSPLLRLAALTPLLGA